MIYRVTGGKRWRPTLLILTAEALGGKLADIIDFVAICELVHNGSLVVDDIEDGSQLRRGKPCLHRIYTLDVAVNAGNGTKTTSFTLNFHYILN